MPKKDIIHEAVKSALIKDGWTITADPYLIEYEDTKVYADLEAEMPIAAERAGRKIVVEIKSFVSVSPIHAFEEALGQYILYFGYLELTAPDHELYLAVSDEAYSRVLERPALKVIVEKNHLAVIVVNLAREEIVRWIDW